MTEKVCANDPLLVEWADMTASLQHRSGEILLHWSKGVVMRHDVPAMDPAERRMLMNHACQTNELDAIRFLLDMGVDCKDETTCQAAMIAVGKCGNIDAMVTLLDANCSIEDVYSEGETILTTAIANGQHVFVRLLLENFACWITPESRRGGTTTKKECRRRPRTAELGRN